MKTARGSRKGRGRLSGIELLPAACDDIVAWAAGELRARERTQTEIYAEFHARLETLLKEHKSIHGGDLEFAIPSFSAFNRYSIFQATMTRRMEQVSAIAGALAKNQSAKKSDDLTLIAAEAIKTAVFEILTAAGESGIDPRGAMQLAAALKHATQAQGFSTTRRTRHDANFGKTLGGAVDAAAKAKGLSAATAEAIKAKILGVPAPAAGKAKA